MIKNLKKLNTFKFRFEMEVNKIEIVSIFIYR